MILFCKSLTLTENNFAFFSSGIVFCYVCIVKYLRKYGKVGDLFPYHYWYLFFPVSSDKPAKQRGTAGQNLCEWVTLVVVSIVGAHMIQSFCKAKHFIWRGLKSEHFVVTKKHIQKRNKLKSISNISIVGLKVDCITKLGVQVSFQISHNCLHEKTYNMYIIMNKW